MTVEDYNKCVDDHADGVYRFILKNLKDQDTARDIVQDAFERLWLRFREISKEKAKSWLFSTAYHLMIDLIRRQKFNANWNESTMEPFAEDGYTDLKEILDEAFRRLPEIQRSVILLRDYEGYSYQEIGDITKLNESQVKVYIFRARNFLKQYIGKPEQVI